MTDELAPPSQIYSIAVDDESIVTQAHSSNMLPDGFIEVDEATWAEASNNVGKRKYTGKKLVEYTPPLDPLMLPALSRLQLTLGLADDKYNKITWQEAEDWATSKSLPCTYELEPRERMYLLSSPSFWRAHPTIEKLQGIIQMDDSQFNEFWQFAGTL